MEKLSHITLLEEFRAALVAHALRELPNECCGLLLGRKKTISRVVPIRSTDPSPDTYYMDPVRQVEVFSEMEKQGESLIGIYHSHPQGPNHPSGMDLQLAFHPGAVYFIISLEKMDNPEIRAYVLEDRTFKEILF